MEDQRSTVPESARPDPSVAAAEPQKPHSTRASWLFNTMLYPGVANTSVLGLSMGITYLADRAHDFKNNDNLFGKISGKLAWRTAAADAKLVSLGMSPASARMSRMVAFSFLDGCAITPVVAFGESHLRKPFVHWYDRHFGTDSVENEDKGPKQSFGSILGGRAAACAVVVPTAVALNQDVTKKKSVFGVSISPEKMAARQKEIFDNYTRDGFYEEQRAAAPKMAADRAEKEWHDLVTGGRKVSPEAFQFLEKKFADRKEKSKFINRVEAKHLNELLADIPKTPADIKVSLNDIAFNIPGYRLGNAIQGSEKPSAKWVMDKAEKLNLKVPKLAEIGAFELFYTTVCTTGLWLGSRTIAALLDKPKTAAKNDNLPNANDNLPLPEAKPTAPAPESHADRVATTRKKPAPAAAAGHGERVAARRSEAETVLVR